jgi:hypothetical protein
MLGELKGLPQTECKCEKCQSYCNYRPCWGTVEEIEKLINAGYANRLMLDFYSNKNIDNSLIIVPALKGYEGKKTPFNPIGICTFYNEITGLCEIHDLKPIEGKISNHDDKKELKTLDVHAILIEDWLTLEGKSLIERWQEITGCNSSQNVGYNITDFCDFLSSILKRYDV